MPRGPPPRPRRAAWLTLILGIQPISDLNRLEEAQATAEEAQAKKLDSAHPALHLLYLLAFLQERCGGDGAAGSLGCGKAGSRGRLLVGYERDTAAYFGTA